MCTQLASEEITRLLRKAKLLNLFASVRHWTVFFILFVKYTLSYSFFSVLLYYYTRNYASVFQAVYSVLVCRLKLLTHYSRTPFLVDFIPSILSSFILLQVQHLLKSSNYEAPHSYCFLSRRFKCSQLLNIFEWFISCPFVVIFLHSGDLGT